MPTYDFRCKECGKKFSHVMSIKDHGKKKARCPKCKSSKVAQSFSSFFVTTSKKS